MFEGEENPDSSYGSLFLQKGDVDDREKWPMFGIAVGLQRRLIETVRKRPSS